jgi:conjugative transfer region protein TrbK
MIVETKMFARIGAIVFVAVAITATAVEMGRKEKPSASDPVRVVESSLRDPLRDEQRRCQQLGQGAASDPVCLRVWAETRDRFLGRTPQPSSPLSSEGR